MGKRRVHGESFLGSISNMIFATFVSVLLLISFSNAQGCPNDFQCAIKGGKCYPGRCPDNFLDIGRCGKFGSRCRCCKLLDGIDIQKCFPDLQCYKQGGVCQFPTCKRGFMKIGYCGFGKPHCECCKRMTWG